MKTYRVYIKNAMTKYTWFFIGTIRAHSPKEAQEEIWKMSFHNPDSAYKFIEQ